MRFPTCMHSVGSAIKVAAVVLALGCLIPAMSRGNACPEEGRSTVLGVKSQEGWGTITGQVVFAGDLPKLTPLKVDKDTDHCLSKGPIPDEKWVVNSANRGVRYVVVFLRPEPGKPLPVHDSLKSPQPPEVVLDQPLCRFEPHVVAMREDQKLVAKNPAPVGHNVVIQGFKNSQNVQVPPNKQHVFQVIAEANAIGLSCGQHPWMKGYLWVFDHPYFAVTDADGRFTIKHVPAGEHALVLWQEDTGWVGTKAGRKVQVKPGGTSDLGKVEIKPGG